MPGETLLLAMVRKGGMRNAMRACTYLASWAICQKDIGHDPTWAEYTSYWAQSESTTAREVRAFKKCMGVKGREVHPSEVWEKIGPVVGAVEITDGLLPAKVMSARWVA